MNWSLHKATAEFGVTRETIRRGLRKADVVVTEGKTYTTKEILSAIHGDLNAERIRETRARADLLERERREKDRELVDLAEVQNYVRESLMPVRQRWLALPSDLCKRCNPTDPLLARDALQRWVDESMALIRGALPKAKGKKK